MNEDELELLRRRLTDELRESVEKELKRRYFWMGAIALVFTSGMLTLIVRDQLFESRVAVETAEEIQTRTTDRLSEAADIAEALAERAEAALERIETLATRADDLTVELSERSSAGLDVSEQIRNDLDNLAKVVDALISERPSGQETPVELVTNVKDVTESISQSRMAIAAQRSRAELPSYAIEVLGYSEPGLTEGVLDALKEAGFLLATVSSSRRSVPAATYSGISLAEGVPREVGVRMVQVITDSLPFIDFVCTGGIPRTIVGVNRSLMQEDGSSISGRSCEPLDEYMQ